MPGKGHQPAPAAPRDRQIRIPPLSAVDRAVLDEVEPPDGGQLPRKGIQRLDLPAGAMVGVLARQDPFPIILHEILQDPARLFIRIRVHGDTGFSPVIDVRQPFPRADPNLVQIEPTPAFEQRKLHRPLFQPNSGEGNEVKGTVPFHLAHPHIVSIDEQIADPAGIRGAADGQSIVAGFRDAGADAPPVPLPLPESRDIAFSRIARPLP